MFDTTPGQLLELESEELKGTGNNDCIANWYDEMNCLFFHAAKINHA